MGRLSVCFLLVSLLVLFNTSDGHFAVMSIDLGSEWLKMALVKPGVPMEIVYNKESKRKTPVVVSMRNGERIFGDDALGMGVRYPKTAYFYLQDLLGKKLDNPLVQQFHKRFPYYELTEHPETGTVMFQHDEDTQYTPEEILAMIMNRSRSDVEDVAGQPIKDAVITVPVYFNQAERRAVKRAAELVGLNVLQLMNDISAVALNYGVFRRTSFNATPTNIMFYDMGATSTTATIVSYQIAKTKEKGVTETNPQLTIKGVGFDRNLGGLEIEMRLQDHFAKLFTEKGKSKNNVRDSPRAMAKLLKEAKRIKKVLSANMDHHAQVESLLDDVDFRAKISRAELEEMCADIFDRIDKPVRMALESSDMTLAEIDQVILVGGGTRVPKIQELLLTAVKKSELGKSINADEAAAMGASYQAAYLSKGYKVKKFVVKEANIYPIQVEFERAGTNDDGEEYQKTVKRTLFGRNNPYPQKKVMTFNKHTDDFSFNVNYGDMSFLKEDDLKIFGKTNLTQVSLSGVAGALNKHTDIESKGVKAHFRMDESGILSLDKVESVFEKMAAENETDDKSEPSAFAKLGSTISNFFSGSSKDDEDKEAPVEEDKSDENKPEKDEGEDKETKTGDEEEKSEKDEEKPETSEKTDSQNDEEKVEKDNQDESDGEKSDTKDEEKEETKEAEEEKEDENKNSEKKDKGKKKDEKDKKEKKEKKDEKKDDDKEEKKKSPKPVSVKEDLGMEITVMDLQDPSKDFNKISKKKLDNLMKKDLEKAEREKALNSLESFIFETQDKFYQEEYEKAMTEDGKNVLLGKLSEASDWLYDDGADADAQGYKDKLKELKKGCRDVFFRVKEHRERPEMMKKLRDILNTSYTFLVVASNFTEEDQIYTDVELGTLTKLINDTVEWKTEKALEQKKTPLYEKPVLLIDDIAEKITAIDREVRYLLNKAQREKPKRDKERAKKEKEKKKKAENETKIEGDEEEKIIADEPQEEEPSVESPEVKTEETQEETPEVAESESKAETDTEEKEEEETLQIGSPDDGEQTQDEEEKDKANDEESDEGTTHDPNEL